MSNFYGYALVAPTRRKDSLMRQQPGTWIRPGSFTRNLASSSSKIDTLLLGRISKGNAWVRGGRLAEEKIEEKKRTRCMVIPACADYCCTE